MNKEYIYLCHNCNIALTKKDISNNNMKINKRCCPICSAPIDFLTKVEANDVVIKLKNGVTDETDKCLDL